MNWFKKIAQESLDKLMEQAQQAGVLDQAVEKYCGQTGTNKQYILQRGGGNLIQGVNALLSPQNPTDMPIKQDILTNNLKESLMDATAEGGLNMQNQQTWKMNV